MLLWLVFQFALMTGFVLASLAIAAAVLRGWQRDDGDVSTIVLTSLGLGPFVLAWGTWFGMWTLPGGPGWAYVAFPVSLIAVAAWYGRPAWSRVRSTCVDVLRDAVPVGWIAWGVAGLVVAVAGLYVLVALWFPIAGNDAMEYASVARMFAEHRDATNYPYVAADPETGYYLPLSHPPGYPALMAFGLLLQPAGEHASLAKVVSPYHLLCTLLLVWFVVRRIAPDLAWPAALVYLGAPLTGYLTGTVHIDPVRMLGFLAGMVALVAALRTGSSRLGLVAIANLVASAFYHSIGVLGLVIACGLVAITLGRTLMWRATFAGGLIVASFAICGPQWLVNQREYGTQLKNSTPVWEMPEIAYDAHLRHTRGTASEVDRVLAFLKGFTRPASFGVVYWLLLLAVIPSTRARLDADTWRLFAALGAFYGILGVAFLAGSPSATMNDRYQYTVQPLAVCIGAALLGAFLRTRFAPRWQSLAGAIVGVACLVPAVLYPRIAVGFRAFRPSHVTLTTADDWATYRRLDIPGAAALEHVRTATPEDATVLSFHQAPFSMYGGRRFVDQNDPRLIPLYRFDREDAAAAWAFLRDRRIDYLFVPGHPFPTRYNTAVAALLADPTCCELLVQHHGYRLFRVRPERADAAPVTSIEPGAPLTSGTYVVTTDVSGHGEYRVLLETEHPDGSIDRQLVSTGVLDGGRVVARGQVAMNQPATSARIIVEGSGVHRSDTADVIVRVTPTGADSTRLTDGSRRGPS